MDNGLMVLRILLQQNSFQLEQVFLSKLLCTARVVQSVIEQDCSDYHLQLCVNRQCLLQEVQQGSAAWLQKQAYLAKSLSVIVELPPVSPSDRQQQDRCIDAIAAALCASVKPLKLLSFNSNAATVQLLQGLAGLRCCLQSLTVNVRQHSSGMTAALAALTGLKRLTLQAPACELLLPAVPGLQQLQHLELQQLSLHRLSMLEQYLPRGIQALTVSCKGWQWHRQPWSLQLGNLTALTELHGSRGRGDLRFVIRPGDTLPASLKVLYVDDLAAGAAPVLSPDLQQLQMLSLRSCGPSGIASASAAVDHLPGLHHVCLHQRTCHDQETVNHLPLDQSLALIMKALQLRGGKLLMTRQE